MAALGNRLAAQLKQLESMKREYGPDCDRKCKQALASLEGATFADAESLVRFHDALLFLRAFPQSAAVVRRAEKLLTTIEPQAVELCKCPDDEQALDDEAVSGIAGTTITNTLTLELARQLADRHGKQLSARWNADKNYRQMGLVLPSCLPLLDDDSYVEADTPYLKWIHSALGRGRSELQWLLDNLDALPESPLVRASLFAGLGVEIAWDLRGSAASRTLARGPAKELFCHREPLLQRKQVVLAKEMASPNLSVQKLNRRDGRAILDMVQDAVTVRYRELQGTTYGDPNQVLKADVGRGVQLYLWGLRAEWRLPLRAYYAGFALKNGVPVNYFEAIGLFEWMEIGFNTFYAFREGETAWIYSQYLHLLHQVAGVTCISVYPYQIGQDNEEAIKSGAFWFYRKLGFRPGRPDLLGLAEKEEKQMARDPEHRTSPRTLRKLAAGHTFFEFGASEAGQWDSFLTRTLGLAVQRKMAAEFDGQAATMRRTMVARLSKVLGVNIRTWSSGERWAFENFALALALVPGVARWTPDEKRALVAVIRAKVGPSETKYLRLLQKHRVLRDAFLGAGSERLVQPTQ